MDSFFALVIPKGNVVFFPSASKLSILEMSRQDEVSLFIPFLYLFPYLTEGKEDLADGIVPREAIVVENMEVKDSALQLLNRETYISDRRVE